MKKLIYLHSSNTEYRPGSFRDYYKTIFGLGPCPVDRFNLLPHIDPDPIEFVNIVPEPIYNLKNLTGDWQDRYFSIFPEVADNVYKTAGTRDIVLMYSGGIDSVAVLVALMKHPSFKDFLSSGKFKIAMSSTSIQEYPEIFFETILPSIPIVVADYNLLMDDPNSFLVTGDGGDDILGNTNTPIFFHNGSTDNLHEDKFVLWPYLNEIESSGKFTFLLEQITKFAPFDIVSVNQMYWWVGQCFVHQSDMCCPYLWSKISDLSEIGTFNKVFRFFFDPKFITFSYEYMSTNPYFTGYNSVRQWPREYIVDYTGHYSYLNKMKVFSQQLLFKRRYKTRIYEDLTFKYNYERIMS